MMDYEQEKRDRAMQKELSDSEVRIEGIIITEKELNALKSTFESEGYKVFHKLREAFRFNQIEATHETNDIKDASESARLNGVFATLSVQGNLPFDVDGFLEEIAARKKEAAG